MTNRYSRNRRGMRDYATKLQRSNTSNWARRGINWRTGRSSITPSGQRSITRNVRGPSTSSGPGNWTAGGRDPLNDLRISAANGGRTNGIWSPDRKDSHGNLVAGHRIIAPTDGAISGEAKLAKYNRAFETNPRTLNTPESLMANAKTGLIGRANKYGRLIKNKDGFLVNAPKTQEQLDSLRENIKSPDYFSDVGSQEFFNQFGADHRGENPETDLGYQNEATRFQEAAKYYNKQMSAAYEKVGGKMPVIRDRFQDGVWGGVELVQSSGNPELDALMMARARARGGKGSNPEIDQQYEGGISSAMLKQIGYDSDYVRDISKNTTDYKRSLDDKARMALAGIARPEDVNSNLSIFALRKMQQEKARDDLLKLAEKQYSARKTQIEKAAELKKKKNEETTNNQMNARIAQLKATGQIVVDANGNLTAGSQQLIDRIRGEFQSRLADINGNIDATAANNTLTLDNNYFTQQSNILSKYTDFVDGIVEKEQALSAENKKAEEERKTELLKLTIKNLGHDEKTASSLAEEMMKYVSASPEVIRLHAPRIVDLLTQINGEQASIDDVNALIASREEEEAAKLIKKKNVEPDPFVPSRDLAAFLSQEEQAVLLRSYLSNSNKVGPSLEEYIRAIGYEAPQEDNNESWFSGLWGGDTETAGDNSAEYNEFMNDGVSELDDIANSMDIDL